VTAKEWAELMRCCQWSTTAALAAAMRAEQLMSINLAPVWVCVCCLQCVAHVQIPAPLLRHCLQ